MGRNNKYQKMKKIVFYSPDFSMCYSILMYLQDKYKITVSNDIDLLKSLVVSADILMLDIEPSGKAEELFRDLKSIAPGITIILTYVYKPQGKELEMAIRHYVDLIFYKPFDLNEVSAKLSMLPVAHHS